MAMRLKAAGGALAIYSVPTATSTDDAPLTDPRNNISRLEFHSSFRYPAVSDVLTVSYTLQARAANTAWNDVLVVTSHSKGFTPWVFATAQINGTGALIPIVGSVPIQTSAGTAAVSGIPRLITIGATQSNVVLHDYGYTNASSGGDWSLPALLLVLKIYVTTEALA